MPKQVKKQLRKIKDKMVHGANDLREIIEQSGDDGLGEIRSHLIDVVNELTTHINERGVTDD